MHNLILQGKFGSKTNNDKVHKLLITDYRDETSNQLISHKLVNEANQVTLWYQERVLLNPLKSCLLLNCAKGSRFHFSATIENISTSL